MKWNNLHAVVRLVLIVMPIMFLCLCCCSIVLIVTPTKDSDKKSNGQTQEEAESQEDVKEEVKGEVIQLYKVTQVVDGDTLKLEIDGREETVRLVGIDTPESVDPRKPVQCFAVEASNKLKELVSGKNVLFEYDTKQGHTDKYGRLLLYIWLPQSDGSKLFINEYMIKEGYAYAYRQIESEYLNEFIDFEEQARVGNKGLWGNVCEC